MLVQPPRGPKPWWFPKCWRTPLPQTSSAEVGKRSPQARSSLPPSLCSSCAKNVFLHFFKDLKNQKNIALAGVAKWTECPQANQWVASLIPSQGTFLGCKPGPQEGAHERQPHIDVSLPVSLSLPLSKNKSIKSF